MTLLESICYRNLLVLCHLHIYYQINCNYKRKFIWNSLHICSTAKIKGVILVIISVFPSGGGWKLLSTGSIFLAYAQFLFFFSSFSSTRWKTAVRLPRASKFNYLTSKNMWGFSTSICLLERFMEFRFSADSNLVLKPYGHMFSIL